MMKGNVQNLYILCLISFFGALAACTDPVKDQEEDEQQVFEDSVEQALIDEAIIEAYIADNGLFDVTEGDYGLRYVVIQEGAGEFPQTNDIVSTHYTGKTVDNVVFDTSIESLAITLDSLLWVEVWNTDSEYDGLGNSFSNDSLAIIYQDEDELDSIAYLTIGDLEMSEILTEFSASLYPLPSDSSLYSSFRSYNPITYNKTDDGTNVNSGSYIFGFSEGLNLLSSELNIGAKGLIIFPSVIGYGSTEISDLIVANSVLVFEFEVDSIRYQ